MNSVRPLISTADRTSYGYLVKWIIIAITSGGVGSTLVHLFTNLLAFSTTSLATVHLPLFVWPAAGAIITGTLIYRFEHRSAGEGLPSYIRSLQSDNGKLPVRVTLGKLFATLATLATFGNGGIVGPLGRIGAGIISAAVGLVIKGTFWTEDDRRTAAICGMAAVVGTIFHTSIGGGIFAVEIIQRAKMGYRDLFPAILSSSSAVFICNAMGWKRFYDFAAVDSFINVQLIGWLLLLAIIAGAAGGAYTMLYARISRLFNRSKGNVPAKVILGSLGAGLLAWSINPELLGTSKDMVGAIFTADYTLLTGRFVYAAVPVSLILVAMIIGKALCNCITVGCGMNAGFTGPAAIIGMLIGMTLANILNIPPGTASYHAFLAAGFASMMASSMNIPLAAAVMTIELFGLQYSFPAGFSSVIGFQVMRHRTIYDYAVSAAADDECDEWR